MRFKTELVTKIEIYGTGNWIQACAVAILVLLMSDNMSISIRPHLLIHMSQLVHGFSDAKLTVGL